jgi:hypothetical protein
VTTVTGDSEQFVHQYFDLGTDSPVPVAGGDVPGLRGVASPWQSHGAGGERLTPLWQAVDERRAKHAVARRWRWWRRSRCS